VLEKSKVLEEVCQTAAHVSDYRATDKLFLQIGAGIQIPPNAVRVMSHFGLVPRLEAAGAVRLAGQRLLDYQTGRHISQKPGGDYSKRHFGEDW